jgi:hypothetical protein
MADDIKTAKPQETPSVSRARRDMRNAMRNAEASQARSIIIAVGDNGVLSVATGMTMNETLAALARAQFKVLTDNA